MPEPSDFPRGFLGTYRTCHPTLNGREGQGTRERVGGGGGRITRWACECGLAWGPWVGRGSVFS